ncbi:MAG: hypothetical protein R3F17_02865 [Planctomycetota bacterium]
MVDTPDRPAKRPYARIERERRFLVAELPEHLRAAPFQRLRDLYIGGTQLRLRRVEDPGGGVVQLKLGQKRPDPDAPEDARHRQMTTCYLDLAEEAALSGLPGLHTVKRRYAWPEQGWTFVLDVYEAPPGAAGTMVAEVECDSDEALDGIAVPAWCVREVTEDPAYSAVALAAREGA